MSKESKNVKVNYILIWAGKTARDYINSRPDVDKADPMKILEELQNWTKPKSNKIAAFTNLKTLNQGKLSLSMFITETTRLVGECGYTTDCDRLLRDMIVPGVQSKQAYQRCISKGKDLMLKDCIMICQSEDSTRRQVKALHPELKEIEI